MILPRDGSALAAPGCAECAARGRLAVCVPKGLPALPPGSTPSAPPPCYTALYPMKGGPAVASALPDLLVQAGIFCLLFLPHRHKYSRSRRLLSGALYIYFCIVLDLTLLPVLCRVLYVPAHRFSINLYPFRDLLHGWGDSIRQILLNVLLFMPFGVLLPRCTGRGFFITLFRAALCSATIELLQPFFDRTCDITDLITNVAGCACGYLIGLPLAQPLQRLGERLDRTENNRRR